MRIELHQVRVDRVEVEERSLFSPPERRVDSTETGNEIYQKMFNDGLCSKTSPTMT